MQPNNYRHRGANLRCATKVENAWNRSLGKNKTGAQGVFWAKRDKRYVATMQVNGKPKYLGSFATVTAASLAQHLTAIKAFGKFAVLNDPGLSTAELEAA